MREQEQYVDVEELRCRPDGSVYGIGNTVSVPMFDAVEGIQIGKYKAVNHSIGQVPEGWEE